MAEQGSSAVGGLTKKNMRAHHPDHQGQSRTGTYEGALDVDVIFSPFFNAPPIGVQDYTAR